MQKAEEDVNEVERLGLGLGLGLGVTELQIETGRWCELQRDEQIFNPLQANLNFIRSKFIQNGGVRKSPYITAAILCAFFKLECR